MDKNNKNDEKFTIQVGKGVKEKSEPNWIN